MINVTEVFKHKPGLMKKAEGYLEALRTSLREEWASQANLFPDGTDLVKGQIARGENHNGFPFISLDLPQKFSKTEYFTGRTLFWWGHYLGFSLIAKKPDMDTYLRRLVDKRHEERYAEIYLSRNPTPWEWERNESNFVPVSEPKNDGLRDLVHGLQYLKLIRFFPLSDPSFPHLDWVRTGTTVYRDLIELVLD